MTEKAKGGTGGFALVGGWIILAISCLSIYGHIYEPPLRDPAIEALLTRPSFRALAGTIGVLIGPNIFTFLALIAGIYVYRGKKNPAGKGLVFASIALIIANSIVFIFLS